MVKSPTVHKSRQSFLLLFFGVFSFNFFNGLSSWFLISFLLNSYLLSYLSTLFYEITFIWFKVYPWLIRVSHPLHFPPPLLSWYFHAFAQIYFFFLFSLCQYIVIFFLLLFTSSFFIIFTVARFQELPWTIFLNFLLYMSF